MLYINHGSLLIFYGVFENLLCEDLRKNFSLCKEGETFIPKWYRRFDLTMQSGKFAGKTRE